MTKLIYCIYSFYKANCLFHCINSSAKRHMCKLQITTKKYNKPILKNMTGGKEEPQTMIY